MKTILHVEDEDRVTILVRAILKDYDYIAVKTIKDAIEIIKIKKIDLILLDLRLVKEKKITGDFEGIKLFNELTKLKKKIPIILLTALSEQAKLIKKENKLVKAIINKPFRIKELKESINHCLNS